MKCGNWVCQTCCRGAEPISRAEGGNLLCLRRPEASRLSLRAWNTSRASSDVDTNTSLSLTAFFCGSMCAKKDQRIKGLCNHVIELTVWNMSSYVSVLFCRQSLLTCATVSHQDTENMNQSGVSLTHIHTSVVCGYKNTSYLTQYIILPVSDHTVLPPLLPFEALQLQHTPTAAVYLQHTCLIPVRVFTVIIAVGISWVVSYKTVLLPSQRWNTLPLESLFGLMEDPNLFLYKSCQDEHFKHQSSSEAPWQQKTCQSSYLITTENKQFRFLTRPSFPDLNPTWAGLKLWPSVCAAVQWGTSRWRHLISSQHDNNHNLCIAVGSIWQYTDTTVVVMWYKHVITY